MNNLVEEYIITSTTVSAVIPVFVNSTILINCEGDTTATIAQSVSDSFVQRPSVGTTITFGTPLSTWLLRDVGSWLTDGVSAQSTIIFYGTQFNDGAYKIAGLNANQLITNKLVRSDVWTGFTPETIKDPHMIIYKRDGFFVTHNITTGGHLLLPMDDINAPLGILVSRTSGGGNVVVKVKRHG